MAIPKLSNLGEALKGLSPLDLRMLSHIYANWADFQAYGKLSDISKISRNTKEARDNGVPDGGPANYIRRRLDELATLGYISKHTTVTGSTFFLPQGIWEKLPPFRTQPWRNPTKKSLKRAAELEAEYDGTRIIRDERETDWRSDDEIYMDEREGGGCASSESKDDDKDDDAVTPSPKTGPPGQESIPNETDNEALDNSEGVDQ